jgi:hypothetical protein
MGGTWVEAVAMVKETGEAGKLEEDGRLRVAQAKG